MKRMARRIGLGRAAYQLWYRPVGWARDLIEAGGPIGKWRTGVGRRGMEAAAFELPLLPPAPGRALELHLLSGRGCWYQSAFCLWTFAHQSARPIHPVIYDDGTLTEVHMAPLRRLFPTTRFVSQSAKAEELDSCLPVARFPVLRERWTNYPNIRKLIDPHVGQSGWKLVIDSDLLFFRRPTFLVDWLEQPALPLHAVDCETSYGYSRPLMAELAGAPIAEQINVGLTGLDGAALDWDKIEYFCRELIRRERTSYFLEQALIAMLLAGRECAIAPAEDYVTLPSGAEARRCTAVMHHYVAGSKKWYFRYNWRNAAGTP